MKQINGFAGGEDDVGRFGLGGAKKHETYWGGSRDFRTRVEYMKWPAFCGFTFCHLSRRNDKTRF